MRYGSFVPLIVATLAGCASLQAAGTRSTEELLSAAGFHVEPADTPEAVANLRTLPARRVSPRTREGQIAYVYADPRVCRCLYVGGETEYQQYERLRLQQEAEDASPAAVDHAPWGTWPWWP
jgi:hypothetical protein